MNSISVESPPVVFNVQSQDNAGEWRFFTYNPFKTKEEADNHRSEACEKFYPTVKFRVVECIPKMYAVLLNGDLRGVTWLYEWDEAGLPVLKASNMGLCFIEWEQYEKLEREAERKIAGYYK